LFIHCNILICRAFVVLTQGVVRRSKQRSFSLSASTDIVVIHN